MKAIFQPRYGSSDVLQFIDVDKPEAKDDEVLVRVHAASVGAWVWHHMRAEPRLVRISGSGLFKPRRSIPGLDLAGRVEAVGRKVERFRPGDEVYGESDGSFAEYTCASEDALESKPDNLTFEQAAAVPVAANTALVGLRDKGELQPDEKVLIIGASGGVGTFAVQIAKSFGAEVTGVCSATRLDLVRSLGADQVIDYTEDDFTHRGERYDVVLELAGNRSLSEYRRVLTPKGRLVLSSGEGGRWIGPAGQIVEARLLAPFVRQKLRPSRAVAKSENLTFLRDLIEAGEITPVMDRTFPLSEAAEAVRYLEEGHCQGKTVITV